MAVVIILTYLINSALTISCYYPDGSLAPNDRPCSITASEQSPSTCCGIGYACLNNTICQQTSATPCCDTDLYIRGSCTDSTWSSNACPNFCISGRRILEISKQMTVKVCLGNPRGGMALFKCSTLIDEYCCYNTNCNCGTSGVIQFAGQPVVETTIGVAAITTSSSSSQSTSTSRSLTYTVPPSGVSGSGSKIGTSDGINLALGLGIGLPGTVAAIIAACIAYRDYRRRHPRTGV